MSSFAISPAEAEVAYVSRYPFALTSGLGISLACSASTTAATALVGRGTVLVLTNIGSVVAMLALGTGSVAATTAYFPVLPGTQITVSVSDLITHAAAITVSGTTTLLIHRGFGN